MNIMQCSLHPTKFSRVSSCSSAKEIWKRLMVIYEGLKRGEEDVKKKKPLALKASPSTKEATEESKSSTSEDD
ncbi:hypothetical protein Taro_032116 [Colocasia esculenta]|uniref:Uncharacterized protein n=1 Tax=Colocasia esculenta TaxID=4460 RepID=A0A843VKI9_COLES|nr:hypothetical protein [Colocasia esculenta]